MYGRGRKKFIQSTTESKIFWNPDENKVVKIQRGNCLIKKYEIHISHGNMVGISNPTVACGALVQKI